MDDKDRMMLNIVQNKFPLVEEPFKAISAELGITEDEAISRLAALKEQGIIRRIGAVFDSRKLGFAGTLCAARVPEERLRDFVERINCYEGITHNYLRDHIYNIWFTLIAASKEKLTQILEDIKKNTGVSEVISMEAVRTFKINASFNLKIKESDE